MTDHARIEKAAKVLYEAAPSDPEYPEKPDASFRYEVLDDEAKKYWCDRVRDVLALFPEVV